MAFWIACLLVGYEPADEEMDKLALMAVARIAENMKPLEDVSFLYEGRRKRFPKANGGPTTPASDPLDHFFQGNYAYRSRDGATVLDFYTQYDDAKRPMRHATFVMLRGTLLSVHDSPDLERGMVTPTKSSGGPGSLNRPGSPESFFFFWQLRKVVENPLTWEFRAVGWDTIDGRSVLRTVMTTTPGSNFANKPLYHLWLDLERGGCPIRLEYEREGVIIERVQDTRLERFELPGGARIWLPVGALAKSFSHTKGESPDSTHSEESCAIVRGSIRFNQGLSDRDFSLSRGGRILALSKSLASDRRFEAAAAKFEPPPTRVDREGVETTLKAKLAEADRQAEELRASVDDGSLFTVLGLQTLLSVVGVVALLMVGYWKWRRP